MKTFINKKTIAFSFMVFIFISCEKIDDNNNPTFSRDDYIGSWSCTEIPQTKNLYFDCLISADANVSDNIKIQNFASLNSTAFAIVNGKSVVLPKQVLNGNTIEGYGTMENKNYIRWSYYVKDNTDSVMYNTNFNRK